MGKLNRFHARYYDAVYQWKDYEGESRRLLELLSERGHLEGTLLDVACGTGKHLAQLFEGPFAVEGLELDPEMAEVARGRLGAEVPVAVGDMRNFRLGRTFDVLTCLFSAIGHMTTPDDLAAALRNMSDHLEPGGVLVVEPWLHPQDFTDGYVSADFVDQPNFKLARMSVSKSEGPISILEMHHMAATPEGVETWIERHELALYTDGEYRDAFASAGLDVEHDPEGLMGRGLYLGTAR